MILNLYWERSESAISETAAKYGHYCGTIAMNILHSREDSDECVNDTYLKAWNAIPPERPNVFSTFLGRITRNLSLDKFKARNAQKRGGEAALLLRELEDCIPSRGRVEDEVEATLLAESIDRFLSGIGCEGRVIFIRRYWYADTIADIAGRFQLSESKVKSNLFRTRNKLKNYLEKEGITI